MAVSTRSPEYVNLPGLDGLDWQHIWPIKPTVTYAGCVLAIEKRYRHVSSDNAMLDSGKDTVAVCWDDSTGRTVDVTVVSGWPMYDQVDASIDATADVRAKADACTHASAAASAIRDAFHRAAVEREGMKAVQSRSWVEVFKGRKIPKGKYWCVRIGDGDFGPYADLSTEKNGMGTFHRYIALGNMRPAEIPHIADPLTADCAKLSAHVLRGPYGNGGGWDLDALTLLCDALEEAGPEGDAYRAPIAHYLYLIGRIYAPAVAV